RRRRPVGLVLVVERVAEAGRSFVQDHRQVRRPIRLVEVVGELPQHRRVAIYRAHRHALRIGQRRQPVIGAKDVGRSVDQVEVLLVRHGRVLGPARIGGNAGQSRSGLTLPQSCHYSCRLKFTWGISSLLHPERSWRNRLMRKIVLVAAAVGALSLAACSEGTQDAAGDAADSAMADAEANMEAAGEAVDDAAAEAGAAIDSAGEATDEAATEVEADVQDETTTEAAVD